MIAPHDISSGVRIHILNLKLNQWKSLLHWAQGHFKNNNCSQETEFFYRSIGYLSHLDTSHHFFQIVKRDFQLKMDTSKRISNIDFLWKIANEKNVSRGDVQGNIVTIGVTYTRIIHTKREEKESFIHGYVYPHLS